MNIISIEGADGSGKSTISSILYNKLKSSGKNVEKYHEPLFFTEEIYNTDISNSKYLFLLFLTSRKKLIQNIKSEKNKILIFDRYIDSTVVYQVLFEKVIDFNTFIHLHKEIIFEGKDLFPDITFILEANIDDLKKRIIQKNRSKLFDKSNIEYIQDLYRKLPYLFSNRIFYFFNTSENSPEYVANQILKIINRKILIGGKNGI